MPSSYKRLGDYISETNERNSDLNDYPLLGVSIQKMFMPSIANIIGTDMSTYKIVYRNQFAYGPVTSRNGDKISIALLNTHDAVLISQAYTSFSINDVNELDPEYLMMWFRRPEFDRYARFKSHGSAREIFDWQELCDTKLPIPSIEKQRAIVKEYNTIEQRINLNNQLIQKLEDTTQTIYKHWFVDFEFPNEEGKPYKSSGGKMVYNEELEKEIPEGWKTEKLGSMGKVKHGYAFEGEYFSEYETSLLLVSPGNFNKSGGFNFSKNKYYKHSYSENYILKEDTLIINMTDLSKAGDTLGNPAIIPNVSFKTLLHNQRVGKVELFSENYRYYIYLSLLQTIYKQYILGTATGTTVRHTSPERIENYSLIVPSSNIIDILNKSLNPIFRYIANSFATEYYLNKLKDFLLSRLAKEI